MFSTFTFPRQPRFAPPLLTPNLSRSLSCDGKFSPHRSQHTGETKRPGDLCHLQIHSAPSGYFARSQDGTRSGTVDLPARGLSITELCRSLWCWASAPALERWSGTPDLVLQLDRRRTALREPRSPAFSAPPPPRSSLPFLHHTHTHISFFVYLVLDLPSSSPTPFLHHNLRLTPTLHSSSTQSWSRENPPFTRLGATTPLLSGGKILVG